MQIGENELTPEAAEIVAQTGVERDWLDVLTLPDATLILDDQGNNTLNNSSLRDAGTPVSCAWRIIKPFAPRAGKMIGTLGLTLTNLSATRRAEGQIDIAIYPDTTCTFLTANPGSYRLAPGGEDRETTRSGTAAGPLYHSYQIPAHWHLRQPSGRDGALSSQAPAVARLRRAGGGSFAGSAAAGCAQSRPYPCGNTAFAVAGTDLALTAHLLEDRPQATDPVKSSLDVYAKLPGAAKITQILLHPPTATTPAQGLHHVGDEWPPTPEIRVTTRLTADGYDLSALIPLSMLGITPEAKEFLLESMVSAYQPGTGTFTYPALFHSVSAFMKPDLFAHVVVDD